MAKHHPDLIMCRKQPGIAIGRLCEKCDGKCVICDSYVRPCTLVRVCDECNYGSFQGRCVICGGVGISDAYYCKECTQQEKDRDGCPKIVNLGSAKTDLFYERKKYGFKKRWPLEGEVSLSFLKSFCCAQTLTLAYIAIRWFCSGNVLISACICLYAYLTAPVVGSFGCIFLLDMFPWSVSGIKLRNLKCWMTCWSLLSHNGYPGLVLQNLTCEFKLHWRSLQFSLLQKFLKWIISLSRFTLVIRQSFTTTVVCNQL